MKKRIIFGVVLVIAAYVLSIVSEATQDSAVITSYVTGGIELIFYLIGFKSYYDNNISNFCF